MNKIKILALCDYGCATGFGQVASNIMQRLNATGLYDITVIGINYDPAEEIDFKRWPGRIIPAITVGDMQQPDVYGRQKVLNELGKGIYDIFFTIQDTFIIGTIMPQILETQKELQKKFSTIFYYPIDAIPKPEWITDVVANIDFPVPYTNYARTESLKIMPELTDKLCEPIYHGTNLKDFYYIEDREAVDQFRNKYFAGQADGKFLITNVNRNQPRKDILHSFLTLKELRERGVDNAILYLHMSHNDTGGNLLVSAQQFGFEINKDFILPSPKVFSVNQGLPIEIINMIYNASDAVLSSTLGEGWGLSITEAMATRTPVVAPNNTSITEILANKRGRLVSSGDDPGMWFNLGAMDNERIRPLMDIEDAADAIEEIMASNTPDIDAAEAWAKKYNWDFVCNSWKEVFNKAYAHTTKLNKQSNIKPNREQRRAMKKKKVAL